MIDLGSHLGEWTGSWSTWLEPGELYDESPLVCTITKDADAFLLEYSGTIGMDAVSGTMRYDWRDGRTDLWWQDSWHTGGKREHLVGHEGSAPSYRYADPEEPWTWTITIEADRGPLVITHHNTPPDGRPAVAVVMTLNS